jgi:hypothetical protein
MKAKMLEALGPRFRGDERGESLPDYPPFVPAEAGTQGHNHRRFDPNGVDSSLQMRSGAIEAPLANPRKARSLLYLLAAWNISLT